MKKIPVWIDCDTGVDDTVAILTALKLPELEVVGISAVSGNTTVDNAFNNTRNVLKFADREDIKVYKGASKPWIVQQHLAENVHGKNGIGDYQLLESNAPIENTPASKAIYEAAKKYKGELVVVLLGPHTNMATALVTYPDLAEMIKEIAIMGGSISIGNANMTAEFNIYADPHAAECVFRSGIHVIMHGLDVTMRSFFTKSQIDENASTGKKAWQLVSKISTYAIALYKMLGLGELFCNHDSCPIVYLAHPEIFKGQDANVRVETQGTITMGKTVCDLYSYTKHIPDTKNTTVMLDIDQQKFLEVVKNALDQY